MKYLGIDIGGMSVKCGIVEDGSILHKKASPIRPREDAEIILADIAALVDDTLKEFGVSKSEIAGIGVGCPGSVDDGTGFVRYCCNVNFVNTPLSEILGRLTGISNIRVSNDANCAALGETLYGAGNGAKNSVLITLGTGVGTGIIVDGRLLTGNRSAGAEGGHITIDMDGEPCGCGKRGHYEAYASATALMRETRVACEKNPDSELARYAKVNGIDGKTVFICAERGDKVAIETLNKYIEYVGTGLVTFANIFYPEVIIIGGGVSNAGDALIEPLKEYVAQNAFGAQYNPEIRVVAATLKNDAGIIGAAALCYN